MGEHITAAPSGSRRQGRFGRRTAAELAAVLVALLIGAFVGTAGAARAVSLVLLTALVLVAFFRVEWGLLGLAAALPWYHITAVPLLKRLGVTAFDVIGLVLVLALLGRVALNPRRFPVRLHPVGVLVAGLTGWAIVASAVVLPYAEIFAGVKSYVAVLVFYWLVYVLATDRKTIHRALTAFLIGTAAAQLAGLTELIGGFTIMGQRAEPLRVMLEPGVLAPTHMVRAAGLAGDPNFFAMSGLAALPVAAVYWPAARPGWKKLMLAGVLLVLILSIVAGASRGVTAAGALGAVLFLALVGKGRRKRFLVVAAVALGLALMVIPRAYFARLFVTGDRSAAYRVEQREAALQAVTRAPVFGGGAGLHVLQTSGFFQYIHNTYLQVSAEIGLPGLVLFLAVLLASIAAAAAAFRRARASGTDTGIPLALLVSLVCYLVFFFFFSYYGNKTFWFLAALASASSGLSCLPVASMPSRQ